MKIIKKYSDINLIPIEIAEYLKNEFKELHKLYSENTSLIEYNLGSIGEFVYIEKQSDFSDLKHLGYTGGIETQSIEFVDKKELETQTIFDLYILRDTDSGTRFVVNSNILDSKLKELFETESMKQP